MKTMVFNEHPPTPEFYLQHQMGLVIVGLSDEGIPGADNALVDSKNVLVRGTGSGVTTVMH